jgi:Undecaprenyl-phosphate glucose phosphotransferase
MLSSVGVPMASDYSYSARSSSRYAILPASGAFSSLRPALAHSLAGALFKIASIEFLVVALSAYLASLVYHYMSANGWPPAYQYIPAAIFIAALVSIFAVVFRHFEAIQTQPRHAYVWSGVGAVGLAFSVFLSAMFLLKVSEDYSRGSFIIQVLSVGAAVIGTRAIAYSRFRSAIADGVLAARRVVLIGDEVLCSYFATRLKAAGISAIGSFQIPASDELPTNAAARGIGFSLGRILDNCRNLHPDDAIILANEENLANIPPLSARLSELPINVHVVPRDAIDLLATSRIVEFGNVVTFQVSRVPLSAIECGVKRAFDIIAALAGLIMLSPVFVCAAIAIKLDSPGPVFFRQTRHGYNNQPIRVLKFRSMTTLEDGSDFKQVKKNDPRITRVGAILRRTNIDELPQLINVLLGHMSIVGPRPHATAHNEMFEGRILPFARRHNVKPGITGWAQVNGYRGATDTLEKMQRRIEYDLYYIDNWSLLLDLRIIAMTLFSREAYLNAY